MTSRDFCLSFEFTNNKITCFNAIAILYGSDALFRAVDGFNFDMAL